MTVPTSMRQREAHRQYRSRPQPEPDCHAYPEDRSQGCFCAQAPNHKGAHACSCGNRW